MRSIFFLNAFVPSGPNDLASLFAKFQFDHGQEVYNKLASGVEITIHCEIIMAFQFLFYFVFYC